MNWTTGRVSLAGIKGLSRISKMFMSGNFSLPIQNYLIPQDANCTIHVNATDLNNGTAKVGPVWTMNGTVPYNALAVPKPTIGPFSDTNYFSLASGNPMNSGAAPFVCIALLNITSGGGVYLSTGTQSGNGFYLQVDNTQRAYLYTIKSGTLYDVSSPGGTVPENSLTMLMHGMDSGGNLYLQINNGPLYTFSSAQIGASATNTYIGRYPIAGAPFTTGVLCELLFSTDTPSAELFTSIYNQFVASTYGSGQLLNISFFYDEDDTYSDRLTWTPVQTSAYPNGQVGSPPTVARFDMPREEMTNLTIEVTEDISQYPVTGLPLQITGISFEGGILPGPRQIGPGSNNYP
jgi:hypothetical protein